MDIISKPRLPGNKYFQHNGIRAHHIQISTLPMPLGSSWSSCLSVSANAPRHIRYFLIATAASALLSACAHIDAGTGVEFRYDKLKELRSGMRMSQVEALLGKPLAIEDNNGQVIYTYQFGNVKAFKVILVRSSNAFESANARLVFKNQLLESFSYEITEPK